LPDNYGLGVPVRELCLVPSSDLVTASDDGASESADLDGHCGVSEIPHDLSDLGIIEFGIGVVANLTNDLFRAPREPHLL
jgi:hypothetical protein